MGILTRGDPVLKERDVSSHQGYQRNFGVMKDNSLILGKNRMTIQEQIEESCLMAADSISEEAKDQGTKTIMDLFKSAILKFDFCEFCVLKEALCLRVSVFS